MNNKNNKEQLKKRQDGASQSCVMSPKPLKFKNPLLFEAQGGSRKPAPNRYNKPISKPVESQPGYAQPPVVVGGQPPASNLHHGIEFDAA